MTTTNAGEYTDTGEWTQVPEPKKMIKVAKYRYFTYHWTDSPEFFKTDAEFLNMFGTVPKTFERLLETEIEVEDY